MSKYKIFIDGESGTTGLQIKQRLKNHSSVEVISIEYEKRKDVSEKKKLISDADLTIFCLPDAAAKETASLIDESQINTRILDASSAHRTSDRWVYGFAELNSKQRNKISLSDRVSNPGCYATGAIALLTPLTAAGLVPSHKLVSINAVSGYSGGGKNLIEKYESGNAETKLVPDIGLYGLEFNHKHTKEIQKWSNLERRPLFIPSVANFHQGMLVHIQLDLSESNMATKVKDLIEVYQNYYRDEKLIEIKELNENSDSFNPYLSPHGIEGKNEMEISVFWFR